MPPAAAAAAAATRNASDTAGMAAQGWSDVEVRHSDTLAQYYITGLRPPAAQTELAAAAELKPQPPLQPQGPYVSGGA